MAEPLRQDELLPHADKIEVRLETVTPANPEGQQQRGKGRGSRRLFLLSGLLLGAAYGCYASYVYFTEGRFFVKTDDAYLKADSTSVAPKISGYVREVLVKDNDIVHAGQVLAHIDDRDFQSAMAQARADLHASQAAVANIDAQIALQGSLIDQAAAALQASRASLDFAASDASRSARLSAGGIGTQSRTEQTQSLLEQAKAAVERDRAAEVAAEDRVPVLRTQREQATAQQDRALAAVRQAELNLSYTRILAAVDGTVGAKAVRIGQFVTSGTQLMAIVPLDAVYVVANFKETQLTNVRAGQPVTVAVDTYPGIDFAGHVDSISPASGSEFSLIPADNATGNFTKVVQRIPVKIMLNADRGPAQLRAGMSVVPRIDTRR